MRKLYFMFGTTDDPLNHFHLLPDVLNRNGVTVEKFQALRIADKPELTYLLLRTMLSMDLLLVPKAMKVMVAKQLSRRYRSARRWMTDPCSISRNLTHLVEIYDNSRNKSQRENMRELINRLVTENGLYDERNPYPVATQVKAKLQGTFAFDLYEYSRQELDNFFTLDCSNCRHSATLRKPWEWITSGVSHIMAADVPYMLEEALPAGGFEHVVGPYVRCIECDKVQRAQLSTADSIPDDEDYRQDPDEEWDNYQSHLGSLVDALVENAKNHGLPEPHRLVITANRIRWDGATGYADCKVDGADLADKLRVDSAFVITNGKLWLEPNGTGMLTCSLAHHDATGYMEVAPVWLSELSDRNDRDAAWVQIDQIPESSTWLPTIAQLLLCGDSEEFLFTQDPVFRVVGREDLISHLEWMTHNLRWDDEAIEDDDTWASQVAGNLLVKLLIRAIRAATTEVEGLELIETAKQLRRAIDAYIVEWTTPRTAEE